MNNKEVEQQHYDMAKEVQKITGKESQTKKVIAVGYLEKGTPFEKGELSEEFHKRLWAIWNGGYTLTSIGHHTCEFCGHATSSAEKILYDGANKVEYVFPEMIFHYIKVHDFKPQKEFIEFIMR